MTTPLDTVPQAKEASVADTTDALRDDERILRQYKESAPPVAPSLHTPPDGG